MPWQANEELYGPGGGDWIDELGNVTPDPYGSLNVTAEEPAAPPEVANFIQNVVPKPAAPAPAAHVAPSAAPPLTSPEGMAAAMDAPAMPPDLRPGQGNTQPGAGMPPDLRPGQGNQPSMIPVTQTTSESSKTTQGLDAAGKANVQSATADANAAATRAGTVEAGNINAQADLQRQQAQGAYGRGVNDYFQRWGELQTQENIMAETDRRLQEAAKFKPDRTALFRGDTGLIFGISAAVAAMAGGWLMGQGLTGGKNPNLDAIFQMIDDDANDQIAQNSAVMDQLTRIYGDSKAAAKDLKARMLQSASDTIAAQSKFQDADTVARGAATVMARIDAEVAKNKMEAAKLTANTVTKTEQTKSQTQMVANPALTQGFDINDPRVVERIGKVGALENLESEARSLAGNGALAGSVGLIDEAADKVAGWFNAKGVPAQRVQALRAKWELIQRANWASEPNGQAVQERLSSIAFPQNDDGIPLFLQNVREALNTVDPGGRYRMVARGMGQRPATPERGNRTPIVR